MISLQIDPDQEGLDVIAAITAEHNATSNSPEVLSVEQYLEYLQDRQIEGWKKAAYAKSVERIGVLFEGKTYAERTATIAALESQ